MSIWKTLREDEAKGLEEIYRLAYYPVINKLMEAGYKEHEAKVYFREGIIFLLHQLKVNDFDESLDPVIYLSTVVKGLTEKK